MPSPLSISGILIRLSMKPVPKRVLFMIPLIVLYSTVAVLALEVGSRLYWRTLGKVVTPYNQAEEIRQVREAFHPDLWKIPYKEYKPGSHVEIKNEHATYETTMNRLGFRDDTLESKKFADRTIIACLGASTTVEGDNNATTYPYRLQEILRKQYHYDVTVVNWGIAGLNTSGYQEALERLLTEIQPTLIIEYNAINDVAWRLQWLWRARQNRLERMLLKSSFVRGFLGHLFVPQDDEIRHDIEQQIMANLQAVAQSLRSRGIRFAVSSFLYPHPEHLRLKEYWFLDYNFRYRWKSSYISYREYCRIITLYNRMLSETSDTANLIYLPLADAQSYSMEDFTDICHMTSSGIEKKAQRLAALLVPYLGDLPRIETTYE